MDNSFKGIIKAIVKASNEFYKNKTSNKSEFQNMSSTLDSELKNAVIDALTESYRLSRNQNYNTNQEFLDAVLEPSLNKAIKPQHSQRRFDKIRANHQRMTSQYEKITDEIKQAVKHDWYDKLRFLLFRILTTAGIAGTAVGMAMLAHSLGYETALIKKKSPEQKVAEVIKTKAITQILSTELETKDSK